ncbi:nucleotide pyrophosphohydrolase [Megasphaera paucivorans]|uniref:NTP pyrophosphatase, house-cleaning of non-canonical NTPs n=1 Tax=Megasphaera paucivorans TaxID=349095 RepID=A0A1H0AYS0_9FIRM|nr:nucleotide pyrophosphohydrolase [Megasphaera paucivorans]SDN38509.1 NTP pyrophosphatase, house-cleaning of non-canonical NTPs [Megasphaera paucivorans]
MMNNGISDKTITSILQFSEERDWKKFHNPKDLALSISLEAAELLECFQWTGTDVEAKEKQQRMKEELADVLIYCVLMAEAIDADIEQIISNKMLQNGKKYPADKAYGNAKKYNELKSQV